MRTNRKKEQNDNMSTLRVGKSSTTKPVPRALLSRLATSVLGIACALLALASHASEGITFYHWDALGSPVAATDEPGNIEWREQYRPYGERIQNQTAAQINTRWYTGHPHDNATGLTYAGARYYDPVVGRFMGVDRQPFTETNIQSFSRYAYGNNNPYKYVDPDGKASLTIHGGVVAGYQVAGLGPTVGVQYGISISFSPMFDIGLTATSIGGASGALPEDVTKIVKTKGISGKIGPIAGVTIAEGSVLDLESTSTVVSGTAGLGIHGGFDDNGNLNSGGVHLVPGSGLSATGEKTEVRSLRRGLNRAVRHFSEEISRGIEKTKDSLLRPRPQLEF